MRSSDGRQQEPAPAHPELTLVTRSGCHLCGGARIVVDTVAADLGLRWEEQSIDDDESLTARFAEEVPVVLVNGVQRDFWKIDPDRLRRILLEAMEPPPK
ncbi:MAG: glutaredoxin family protein [Actinomycetota bacterium]|uniref:glutaredoxin family protein n=1 Tax=Micrococcaceae TaxID=1268 RepID=UPI0024B890FB|nr:glutaredoxin family protein [Paenarthrobacter sp. PH39-S1]MDJ0355137.1 glutaredoxin family protein [Paenarthrobacter sp. PH39-S1]MDQ6739341.1 glutaredoxin family protein [Actinomycetota bacterium]